MLKRILRFFTEVKEIMATVYATLIIKGLKKVSQVPTVIRPQVEKILKELLEVEQLPDDLY